MVNVLQRSLIHNGVWYTNYLGDGDSNGSLQVTETKPYGDTIITELLNHEDHIQKSMVIWLKKLGGGKKFPGAKPITGQDHITDAEVDLLQRYYGLAVRRNQGNLKEMRKAVWVMFCHKL